MQLISQSLSPILFILTLFVWMVPHAHAHQMVAQHGTLNVVDDGAYMVLSVPITAFEGIDSDKDGMLSMEEFTRHRLAIAESVKQNVVLRDLNGSRPLEGMMLSPVPEHETASGLASQVIVMGRFALEDPRSALLFQVNLFGERPAEQLLEITAFRQVDSQEHDFELTPTLSAGMLFPEY
jgi:hypothetical protein